MCLICCWYFALTEIVPVAYEPLWATRTSSARVDATTFAWEGLCWGWASLPNLHHSIPWFSMVFPIKIGHQDTGLILSMTGIKNRKTRTRICTHTHTDTMRYYIICADCSKLCPIVGGSLFTAIIFHIYFTYPHLENDGRWLPRLHRRGHRTGMAALFVCLTLPSPSWPCRCFRWRKRLRQTSGTMDRPKPSSLELFVFLPFHALHPAGMLVTNCLNAQSFPMLSCWRTS